MSCLQNTISEVKGIGKKTKEKLDNAGIKKVKEFITGNTSPDAVAAILTIISNTPGCSLTTVQKFHAQASSDTPSLCPGDINYLAANNPYQACYGGR